VGPNGHAYIETPSCHRLILPRHQKILSPLLRDSPSGLAVQIGSAEPPPLPPLPAPPPAVPAAGPVPAPVRSAPLGLGDTTVRLAANWRAELLRARERVLSEVAQVGHIRAQQLQAALRLIPMTLAANVLAAALVAFAFWDVLSPAVWAAWGGMIATVGTLWMITWWRSYRGHPRARADHWDVISCTAQIGAMALVFSVMVAAVFPVIDADGRLVVGTLVTGMICAGAFALASLPPAALTWIAMLALGAWYALLTTDTSVSRVLAALLGVYCFAVGGTVLSMAQLFRTRLEAQAELERQGQVVGLLLRDFEEHSSDWLWETDWEGRLTHVSARLAQLVQRPAEVLMRQPLVQILLDTFDLLREEERAQVLVLKQRLEQPLPFRDLVVPVVMQGRLNWWSFTAKPIYDITGAPSGWRGVGSDITAKRQHELEMMHLANFDSLTGLSNRRRFRGRLEARVAESREGAGCALLLLDLDNFKAVNDSLGHGVGDRLLQMVARRLETCVRPDDVLARLGGDEYALLCSRVASLRAANDRGHELLEALSQVCVIDDVRIEVRGSVGVALAPEHGSTGEELMRNADTALYAAKDTGRGAVRLFDSQLDRRSKQRFGVLTDLSYALEKNQFELHYQPQVCLGRGRVVGFEALLRWRHPERGLVSPLEFIPFAEETGLVLPIGEWVLERACTDAQTWGPDMKVAVNLSAVQVCSQSVVDSVTKILTRTGLDPHRLELEMTETSLIRDGKAARMVLFALRELGVRVALDDFGTGYSSLAYLRRFPLDKIKIDRAFIAALMHDTNGEAHAIVSAILQLAATLQLDTTAEGIEHHSQLVGLRANGCNEVQGFLIAQPMMAHEVKPFIDRWADPAYASQMLAADEVDIPLTPI
jgi:diguanylate cyclase (GGDEF)-like protein